MIFATAGDILYAQGCNLGRVGMLSAACGGSDNEECDGTGPNCPGIGVEGGTVTQSGVTLEIPAGALSRSTVITIKPAASPPADVRLFLILRSTLGLQAPRSPNQPGSPFRP